MCALSVIGSNLIGPGMKPLSAQTGATSKSDPNAGTPATKNPAADWGPITTQDKAGAGIMTVLIIVMIVGGSIWLVR